MIWNIFSSKESTFAFCALSNLLLSNTHLRQLHAGQTLRQALQRIQLLNWLWKNANFSSGLIASIFSTSAKRSASFMDFQNLLKLEYGILVKDHRGRFSYLPADREKFISARTLGTSFDREHLLLLFQCNAAEKEKQQCRVNDPMDALYIKSNLRLVVNLQDQR